MTQWLKVIGRRAAFNQALALPIGLIIGSTLRGEWLPSFIIATTFSQCCGLCCWGLSPLAAPYIRPLRPMVRRLVWFAVHFTGGVLGAEIARRICISLFGYRMEGTWAFFSLAVGASVAVLAGMMLTTVKELQVNLESAEQALRERELAEARLRQAASDAELAALQARINPHFLFNTLNSIAALIAEDPAKAETVTWQLSSLFRYALQANTRGLVTVEEELTIVRKYLDIEKVRLGNRLEYHIDVTPELGAQEIPALLLQPLVENAIKHGIAPQIGGGVVRIVGHRAGNQAIFTITNSIGPVSLPADSAHSVGPASLPVDSASRISPVPGAGVGLENVRERLETMYGGDASVTLSHADGVTTTRVTVPLSISPAASS